MARMIPSSVAATCKSDGEREVFWRLRDDPETRDWIVLHSLDIARHRSRMSGEIDFVVIVPHMGVLCVEVKGCSHLNVTDDGWYYGSNPVPDTRGPFKQAAEAMHSLRGQLPEEFASVPFWTAVVFPFTPFTRESVEWHTWQVVDARAMRASGIARLFAGILGNARAFLRSRQGAGWFNDERGEPTERQCEDLARFLRPHFEYFESPRTRVQWRKHEINRYTQEQYEALDGMDDNPRAIFQGPAGTGKTVLALAAAQRARAANRKTLFLCFNRLLGEWIHEATAGLVPLVAARTIGSHMLRVANITPSATQQSNPEFWRVQLPEVATNALLGAEGEDHLFDELIVDEAQDLLHNPYLDFLDLSLRGGLAAGRWRLFGDFEKQAIYGDPSLSPRVILAERGSHAAFFTLRRNCRNTPRVADLARLLGGLNPYYSKILRPDDAIDPEPRFYRTPDDQRRLLIQSIRDLRAAGFSDEDIVILSPLGASSCAATLNAPELAERLGPYRVSAARQIRYATVHSFKGLEAPAVILTDIEGLDERTEALFYIGVTRALQRLVVLISEAARPSIEKALFRRPSRSGL